LWWDDLACGPCERPSALVVGAFGNFGVHALRSGIELVDVPDPSFGCLVVARPLPCLVSLPCSRGSCSRSTFSHHTMDGEYDGTSDPRYCTFVSTLKLTWT
jgi:hypothetical protein